MRGVEELLNVLDLIQLAGELLGRDVPPGVQVVLFLKLKQTRPQFVSC